MGGEEDIEQLVADVGAVVGFARELVRKNVSGGFFIGSRCGLCEGLRNVTVDKVPGNLARSPEFLVAGEEIPFGKLHSLADPCLPVIIRGQKSSRTSARLGAQESHRFAKKKLGRSVEC